MPSLPPRDGVVAPPCAGIRAGASTVSTDATLNSVVGPSLPLRTTGEHDATGSSGRRRSSGSLGIASPSPLHGPQEHGGGLYTSPVLRPLVWVVGTHAHIIWGVNANMFPSPSHQHGGGKSPTARTPTPLVGVTPSSHPMDIVEWAARASPEDVSEDAHEILAYWDANATPHERSLFWATNAGPPLSSHLSI